jgi:hypothetical protein
MRSSSCLAWIRETQVKINAEIKRDGVDAVRERVRTDWCRHAARRLTPRRSNVLLFPQPREAKARQRGRRDRAARSSARSGDSGSDDPGESDPAADWHWKQPDSWAGLIASVRSRDFERELHVERWRGVRA